MWMTANRARYVHPSGCYAGLAVIVVHRSVAREVFPRGRTRRVIEPFQVMVFAGIGRQRCGFLANCFCDSFESEAVIPCPRDDRGRVTMRPRERQETGEQDLF